MAEVLVLVDHVGGSVKKTTSELLTIARRLGEPSAVFFGSEAEQAKEALARFGAAKVYVVDDPATGEFLVAPKAEAVAQLVERTQPAAVLIPSYAEGKEIAGRLAIKLGSGVITDAVDVQPGDQGPQTTQSVFAGNFTVKAHVSKGTPVITVKPNSATPEPADGSAEVEKVDVTISD